MSKVTVIYDAKTRHVLATITRTADRSNLPLEQLASPYLLVRGWVVAATTTEELPFHIPATFQDRPQLEVKQFDPINDVQGNPWDFRVKKPAQGEPFLDQLSGDPVTIITALDKITINLPANATEETPVWIKIEGGSLTEDQSVILEGSIAQNNDKVVLNIAPPLPNGTYRLIALVENRPLFLMSFP